MAEVQKCLQESVRLVADIKKSCQQLIGRFIECVVIPGITAESDRMVLDLICPRVSATVKVNGKQDNDEEQDNNEEQDNGEEDVGDSGSSGTPKAFLEMLLRYLYSGKYPTQKAIKYSEHMQKSIDRLDGLGLLAKTNRAEIRPTMPYPPTTLTQSIVSQLSVEFKRTYRKGNLKLHKKLQAQKVKGRLPAEFDIEIHADVSSIEDFVRLNKINKNHRRLVPMTPSKQPFISFAETDLLILFWKSNALKKKLQELIGDQNYALRDAQEWLSLQEPGLLVARLLTDAGRGEAHQRRKPGVGKSITAAVRTISTNETQEHLEFIRQPTFNPSIYDSKGYILRGSIRTDGFRLQLLAFKLKELKSVRYKRLPANVLPPRLTSTVGGTDYYLTEVRSVVKTQQDVTALWGCRPEEIKILGLDLGQTCVVGVRALLPDEPEKSRKGKKVQRDQDGDAPTGEPSDTMKSVPRPAVYYNMAVKQKAVYQPIFKLRRWLEEQKRK
ncbi:hypothetical protein BGZ51_006727, partial [Haplosporangium sp. Z 767]